VFSGHSGVEFSGADALGSFFFTAYV